MRLGNVEQFRTDRGHSSEMLRPRKTAQVIGNPFHIHICLIVAGVHLLI